MTPPKTKAAKENGELSETAKSALDEIAIREIYGREKPLVDEKLQKGKECEEEAISLLTEVEDLFLVKNEKKFNNEFVKGYPDIVEPYVYDTKVPFDIWNFHKAEPPVTSTGKKTEYYWQLMAYLWLTGKQHAYLAYCLIDMPTMMLSARLHRDRYKFSDGEDDPEYKRHVEKVEAAYNYSDIPKDKRVKTFHVERNEEDIEAMQAAIGKGWEYIEKWEL